MPLRHMCLEWAYGNLPSALSRYEICPDYALGCRCTKWIRMPPTFHVPSVRVDKPLRHLGARVPFVLWDPQDSTHGQASVKLFRMQCNGTRVGFDGRWGDGSVSELRQNQVSPFHLTLELNQPKQSTIERELIRHIDGDPNQIDMVDANRQQRNSIIVDTHLRLCPKKDVGVLDGPAMRSAEQLLMRTGAKVLSFQKNDLTFMSQLKMRKEHLRRERILLVPRNVLEISPVQMIHILENFKIDLGGFYFDFTCCFDTVNWSSLFHIVRHMHWFMITLSPRGFPDTAKSVAEKLGKTCFHITKEIHNPTVMCFLIERRNLSKWPIAKPLVAGKRKRQCV